MFADVEKLHSLIYEMDFHLSEACSPLNMLHVYNIAYPLKQKEKLSVFIAVKVMFRCMAGSVSL
jgi:hypothetical protein